MVVLCCFSYQRYARVDAEKKLGFYDAVMFPANGSEIVGR